jgi:hypothetical protein
MSEADVFTLRRSTAHCGCTSAGPGADCDEGHRLFSEVQAAYAAVLKTNLVDNEVWSAYETGRYAFYRHLGERVTLPGLQAVPRGVGKYLLAQLTIQVYNAQVYNPRTRDLVDCQRVATEMLKTLRPDVATSDYVAANLGDMVAPDAPGYQLLELATLTEQQARGFDAYWLVERGSPYFVERGGNSWIVSRWDLTRRDQRAVSDMQGVRWVAGLGVNLYSPECQSLVDALLTDPGFQSCRRRDRLMLIPSEPRLIAGLLAQLHQARQQGLETGA